tara:strand:+ start:4995 stop:5165 length:171 start_codon:yes stop_codon:yes gene_type:complete
MIHLSRMVVVIRIMRHGVKALHTHTGFRVVTARWCCTVGLAMQQAVVPADVVFPAV